MKTQDVTMVGHSLGAYSFFLLIILFICKLFVIFCVFHLGAHIAGLAAKQVESGNRIAAIIGLDPASVGFDYSKSQKRLAVSDADYVQIIHTDGKKYGFSKPLGHGMIRL